MVPSPKDPVHNLRKRLYTRTLTGASLPLRRPKSHKFLPKLNLCCMHNYSDAGYNTHSKQFNHKEARKLSSRLFVSEISKYKMEAVSSFLLL